MLQRLQSVKTKIIALYLVMLVTTLIFTGYFLQRSLENYFSSWLERKLIKEMNLILTVVDPFLYNRDYTRLNSSIITYGEELETRITIIDLKGKVLADSRKDPSVMENHLYRPEVQEVLKGKLGKEIRYSSTLDMNMKYIALPIKREDGEVIGVIRASLTLNKLKELYHGIWTVLLKSSFFAIVVAVLLSLKLTNQITDPIREITSAAQKIANGYLDHKLVIRTKDEIGQLALMFNYMVDRVKDKMQEISGEKNKVEAIVTSIGDAVIAVNKERRIILFNLAAERIFGIKEDLVLDKSVIQITKNYKLDELVELSLEKNEIVTEELEMLVPEQRVFRVQIAPIEGIKESTVGVVAVLRDITDIRRLEEMRKEFVGNVSHELKTPLTSIKGYVETLLDSEPDKQVTRSFLSIIREEANRLQRLIEDLLSLSRLESKFEYSSKEQVDMIKVINDTIFLLGEKARRKSIILEADLPVSLPLLKANRDQMSRLMINLVDNAIKYTPDAGRVKARAYNEDEKLILEVEDTGLGIPEKDLPRIFERFYRVDKARSRKLGGTGLGLSIIKHIIEEHQGEISVESKLGEGSKFIVELPLKD
ncbi:PAS/PAC sensor signal transduction histidine kinase [Orenia metallireducens]|uniref:histidine kinase n=1 Tax=Orenia metallireducens TaxID=1413210 RepID=A0A285HU52_9FIRM|nr:ATP-binding protein [Orenia metallireducens]PRX25112.1 PAS/PAC sensor signal transduction histidine kinase [Orenia metallireducens]SNY38261.1 PAS/PAC sensor signal transduction histidine kinase [Orenia metallireducens]